MSIQYLDPEIANEGFRADNMGGVLVEDENGEYVFQSFTEPPRIPDYAFVKNAVRGKPHPLRRYFPQYSGIPYRHQTFPAWAYHANGQAKLVRSAEKAAELGMVWNRANPATGAVAHWTFTGEWRPQPVVAPKPDLHAAGKSFIADKAAASEQNIAAIIASVMAMQKPAAPAGGVVISDAEAAMFAKFKAFMAGQPVEPIAPEPKVDDKGLKGAEKVTNALKGK